MLGKPGNHVAFAASGVVLRHTSRDQITIDQIKVKHPKTGELDKSGERRQLVVTYDQAYDLKQQLINFLGAYAPDGD